MSKTSIDALGDALRIAVTIEALKELDAYRRSFRENYDAVVERLRQNLAFDISGRPAKSTTAIVDKLNRGSMRLSQMQDIAGCRIVVPNIENQDTVVRGICGLFDASVADRREKPSHGYRAVHVIVRLDSLPIEIQVRTALQHTWAELSEKFSDVFGADVKYGGGPPRVRGALDQNSDLAARIESLESKFPISKDVDELRQELAASMLSVIKAADRQT